LWVVEARYIVEEGEKRQRTKQGEADEEARVKVTARCEDKAGKILHGKQRQPPPDHGRGFGILI
jgi:hypothetical protein